MSVWPKSSLGSLVDLRLSSVDKKTSPVERSVRLCNYTDVYKNSFIHGRLDFMDATATDREIANCALYAGDVIITKDSEKHDDIGVPALVRENVSDLVCGYHLAILRPTSSDIDGSYLYYALNTRGVQQQFHACANGVTRFGLRKADIALVQIPRPPISEQRAIARVLGALDDKIEANRRMSATLEGMAQAAFKDWFVDFGPVRAKAAGRAPWLPDPLWSLFPDRLVDSELGEIPEGWEVGCLGDLSCKPQYGYTASARADPTGPQFLRITDINKSNWINWGVVPYCDIDRDDIKKYALTKGDILIARMADPGHGVMIEENRNAVFASYLIRFRPLQQYYGRYLQYWLRSASYWSLVRARAVGTTRVSLNAKVLGDFPTVVPSSEVLEAFSELIEDLRSRVVTNSSEEQTLGAMRDALLPRLVSGELRVRGIE